MIDTITHPEYSTQFEDWLLYGLAYKGTNSFVDRYLRKFSDKESDTDFQARKKTAYVPRYAASAVTEVKNAILQRLVDIKRDGGSDTYRQAITGKNKGVDYENRDMTTFMGDLALIELLVYGRVGVLVDNFTDVGITQRDQTNHPYVKIFSAPSIRSWNIIDIDKGFDSLLLQEQVDVVDEGLISGFESQYRKYQVFEGGVEVTVYKRNPDYKKKNEPDYILDENESTVMDVPRIPFTVMEIPCSLMTDIARMQAELMNLESSDIGYVLQSNFPFLVSTYVDEGRSPYAKTNAVDANGNVVAGPTQVEAGSKHGISIPEGALYPKFIAPPIDNLSASMEKGEQIKNMIRSMLHLNLQALTVSRESAESKAKDDDSMEAGLSVIAKTLEIGEMSIADHWGMFDRSGEEASIKYPEKFSLLSTEQRLKDAQASLELADNIPSITYKRESYKMVVKSLYGTKIPSTTLDSIYKEIDKCITFTTIKDQLLAAEAGILSHGKIAEINGSTAEDTEQAKQDKLDFVKSTIAAQGGEVSAARGVPETGDNTGEIEKENKTKRGEQK